MIDTYKELLYKNQLDLAKLEEKKPENIFASNIPVYQNPDIRRPSVDPYEILHDYRHRTATGEYKRVILVHFDKLPDGLRGWTDGERFAEINQEDYKPYVVIAHELTHIKRRGWPEYMVRSYSPKDIRTLEELRARFSEFDIVFI